MPIPTQTPKITDVIVEIGTRKKGNHDKKPDKAERHRGIVSRLKLMMHQCFLTCDMDADEAIGVSCINRVLLRTEYVQDFYIVSLMTGARLKERTSPRSGSIRGPVWIAGNTIACPRSACCFDREFRPLSLPSIRSFYFFNAFAFL